jgi:hypothetical protein
VLAGNEMLALSLVRATGTPPRGAGAGSRTVQRGVCGAVAAAGEHVKVRAERDNSRKTDRLTPFDEATTVALCVPVKLPVVALKGALRLPEGIVTLIGTLKFWLLLVKLTAVALVAGFVRDTVQELEALLPIVEGEQETSDRLAVAPGRVND